MNEDCAYILKKCYQDNTKKELMENEEVMRNFFGSAQEGKKTLESLGENVWESME